MSARTDGGPAFPTATGTASDDEKTVTYCSTEPGMSLRDWFAGQAIVGVAPNLASDSMARGVATWAYLMADAMLAERRKP